MARSDKHRYFSQKKEYDDHHKVKALPAPEQPIQVSTSAANIVLQSASKQWLLVNITCTDCPGWGQLGAESARAIQPAHLPNTDELCGAERHVQFDGWGREQCQLQRCATPIDRLAATQQLNCLLVTDDTKLCTEYE